MEKSSRIEFLEKQILKDQQEIKWLRQLPNDDFDDGTILVIKLMTRLPQLPIVLVKLEEVWYYANGGGQTIQWEDIFLRIPAGDFGGERQPMKIFVATEGIEPFFDSERTTINAVR